MPPDQLKALYDAEIAKLVDFRRWASVVAQEREQRIEMMRDVDPKYDEPPTEVMFPWLDDAIADQDARESE